jgi:hypothetical protein
MYVYMYVYVYQNEKADDVREEEGLENAHTWSMIGNESFFGRPESKWQWEKEKPINKHASAGNNYPDKSQSSTT